MLTGQEPPLALDQANRHLRPNAIHLGLWETPPTDMLKFKLRMSSNVNLTRDEHSGANFQQQTLPLVESRVCARARVCVCVCIMSLSERKGMDW